MIQKLMSEFNFNKRHLENLINLADEGNTVPFIARYRKEQTGAMDEVQIRSVLERYDYIKSLENRKSEVLKIIEEKGKLTPALLEAVKAAETISAVEDLYAPYKTKRKTKADAAREAGLEPLADYIRSSADLSALEDEAGKYLTKTVPDTDTAVSMARDIITEQIGYDIDVKERIRDIYASSATISSEHTGLSSGRTAYEDYYGFTEAVATIPPHRVMAIFRGEREDVLKVGIDADEEQCIAAASGIIYLKGMKENAHTARSVKRAVKSMLIPSVETEVRGLLREAGEERAIQVFADNLKRLIMTPPVRGRVVMGLDPAFRTGCKVAVVDETGRLLNYGVMHPVAPQNDYSGSKRVLVGLADRYAVNAIAIGNGTASRETEEFVAKVISEEKLSIDYTIVNEAGASVYSASEVAAKEFPDLDLTIRGAVSIARRVIDPLAEFVKIEPQSIGVGMYQHDVNKKKLENSLKAVVEDVVNSVGVDLNTASASLLSYIAGLNNSLAEKIVKFREKAGRFSCREQLLEISGIGEAVYRQCAGFLKIYEGEEKLDSMFIHPESYSAVKELLAQLGLTASDASKVRMYIKVALSQLAQDLGVGEYTLADIVENLEKPDRDIRDSVPPVVFKKDVVDLNSLTAGMIIDGVISNVVDFGAFVDIGLKNDGLVHISELSKSYVKNPKDVASAGQRVKVKVLSIDKERGRVSLSMKI